MNRMNRRTWRRPGFSLLELSLVLALLGVLMAVAAYNVMGMGEKGKIKATKATLATIKNMLQTYQVDHSVFPPDLQTLITAKVMEDKKIQDGFSQPLYYATPGLNGRSYELLSAGPDTKFQTPDDIDVWTMDR
ncbi:MAG TPA: type II secretion system protein GspG [Phycisphaerales bacterium]|nr:type II secretion system protein GspG [Phycisphaerales bacterium]